MSKEERIQEITATVERIRQAHGVIVFDREDGEGMDVILRDCGLCIDAKELTKACGILWQALIAAETKLEPQTANADVLADRHYIAGAKVGFSLGVEGNSKGLNKLIADRQREIGDYLREPQTVVEPIDWRQYAIGLDNAYTSWDSEARALAQQAQDEDAATDFMVGKITDWLKSFVQRIHSSDTKGLNEALVEALPQLNYILKTGCPCGGRDESLNTHPHLRCGIVKLKELAESALTSYRERK